MQLHEFVAACGIGYVDGDFETSIPTFPISNVAAFLAPDCPPVCSKNAEHVAALVGYVGERVGIENYGIATARLTLTREQLVSGNDSTDRRQPLVAAGARSTALASAAFSFIPIPSRAATSTTSSEPAAAARAPPHFCDAIGISSVRYQPNMPEQRDINHPYVVLDALDLWPKLDLITTQAKRNLSSRSGIGGVRSAT